MVQHIVLGIARIIFHCMSIYISK